MNERIIYSDQYRDINFTICKFKNSMRDMKDFHRYESEFNWCHYIHLNLDKQIEDEEVRDKLWLSPIYMRKNECSYEYYDSIINDIDFHGGCTFYSKESSEDDKFRCIKVGCDYQHSWDVGKDYSLEYVIDEAHKTIDSFIENVSPVLKWCSGCGVYYKDVTKKGCGECEYSKEWNK